MARFKQITVDMIYISVLKEKLEVREDGGMYWVQTNAIVPRVGSIIMESIGWVLRYSRYIHVRDVAERLEVDEKELSPCIHLLTGQLASEFLVAYRMKQAKEWLACTDLTVTEIAKHCGMKWQSVLTERFKKLENTTPTEYRNTHRPKNFRELYRWK